MPTAHAFQMILYGFVRLRSFRFISVISIPDSPAWVQNAAKCDAGLPFPGEVTTIAPGMRNLWALPVLILRKPRLSQVPGFQAMFQSFETTAISLIRIKVLEFFSCLEIVSVEPMTCTETQLSNLCSK